METRTEIEIEGQPWRVTVSWRGTKQDRPVPTSITLTAAGTGDERGEVTSTLLRQVPVGRLLAEMRPQPAEPAEQAPEVKRTGRPPKFGPEHYRVVAEIYRAALAAGSSPVQSVAEHFDASPQTARRWVHLARNRHGLLPAVRRGQAG
jgi:hypothetical protein